MFNCISCTVATLTIGGRVYERVPFGKEQRDDEDYNPQTCPDCAAPVAGLHHVGCDWEECPACGGQLLGCRCDVVPVEAILEVNPLFQLQMRFEEM